jgi:hypothetical protein
MVVDARFARRCSLGAALVAAISLSGLGSVAVAAGPASAATTVVPCATRVESTPFAAWGDTHSYFLLPNGGFESGPTGWTLAGGAAVASGNEGYFANSAADSHSLAIPAGGQATSSTICIGRDETSFRFFVKSPGVAGAQLRVQAFVQGAQTSVTTQTTVSAAALGTAWSPTIRVHLPKLTGSGTGTENVTLVFSTAGTAANWSIDDVFIDPFRMR